MINKKNEMKSICQIHIIFCLKDLFGKAIRSFLAHFATKNAIKRARTITNSHRIIIKE